MKEFMNRLTCKNCGAPITSEICQYCGCRTGLSSDEANADYPIIECKEATIGFWTTVFPLVFAITFGGIGCVLPIIMINFPDFFAEGMSGDDLKIITFFCIPFGVIGLIATVIAIRPIIRYFVLKNRGKQIKATVCGYINDNVLLNGHPAQVVKLIADTTAGKRYLMYQLGRADHPYGINTELDLLVYKDYFLIIRKKETINW